MQKRISSVEINHKVSLLKNLLNDFYHRETQSFSQSLKSFCKWKEFFESSQSFMRTLYIFYLNFNLTCFISVKNFVFLCGLNAVHYKKKIIKFDVFLIYDRKRNINNYNRIGNSGT